MARQASSSARSLRIMAEDVADDIDVRIDVGWLRPDGCT